jgi:hypothetical protein
VQAGVDAGGRAGAGDDPAVLDVEDVLIHQGGRVLAREFLRVVPVSCAAAAVEQASPGQGKGAGADRHHPGATGVGGAQSVQHGFGQVLVAPVRGHDDQVGVGGGFQPEAHVHRQPGLERNIAGLRGADAEVEGWDTASAGRSVDAEDLESSCKLEDREVGDHDHRH